MSYDIILFDLDGTLTNPAEGITTAVAYALDYFGNKYESKKALELFIGPPLREQFMEYCNVNREMGEKYVEKYREYYSVKGIYQNKVYEGIDEMLSRLKQAGKKVVLATSKPEKFAEIILRHYDLYKYFDFVAGALMSNTRTKKSEVIEYALKSIGCKDIDKVIMVGDRLHDVEGAAQFGIKTVGVTFGFGSRQELTDAGAVRLADNAKELTEILLS